LETKQGISTTSSNKIHLTIKESKTYQGPFLENETTLLVDENKTESPQPAQTQTHYSTKKCRDIELTTPVQMSLPACLIEVYKGAVTVYPFIIINNITANVTLHIHCVYSVM
jgi:hypothetical protein